MRLNFGIDVYKNLWAVGLLALLQIGFAQRIGVIGDWGADSPHRPRIAASMRASNGEKPLEFILTLGDNFYEVGVPVQRFVDDLPKVKIYPTFGNHDVPQIGAQLKLFGADRTFYNIKSGELEIFVLYSENFNQAQRDWLEEALKASSARWKIVALHRPLYSSGLHGSARALRLSLEPLLTQYKVALVLAGHDHEYERLEAKGITHIVSGGGGAYLRDFFLVQPQSKVRKVSPNYLILEATAEKLSVTALNDKNEVLDKVEIK